MPNGTNIVLANSWNGFAFRRPVTKLVVVEHHCIFDSAYISYRSFPQAIFHEQMIRRFEQAGMQAADALVAVSSYTAQKLHEALGGSVAEVIYNGVDTDFFSPCSDAKTSVKNRTRHLLFVGNLSRRKGADLLPDIMRKLGPGYELGYTSSLRTNNTYANMPGMQPLGHLNMEQLVGAYREADLVLFPTRLEGFGYVAAEAMACGTPVVATNCSALPELIENGVTGRLCPMDDTTAFADAVRELTGDPERLTEMGQLARTKASGCFNANRMVEKYLTLFDRLLAG